MTPEQFLAQTGTDDDDLDDVELVDPLASIAESLRAIAEHLTADAWVQEKADDKASENDDLHAELRRAHKEVYSLHAVIEQVRELVKPSTSKLANSIRAAIDPRLGEDIETASADSPGAPTHPGSEAQGGGDDPAALPGAGEPLPTAPADPAPDGPPANDALVEAWRGYARRLGYTGSDVDHMNRSQIRTMLGVPQPVDGARG